MQRSNTDMDIQPRGTVIIHMLSSPHFLLLIQVNPAARGGFHLSADSRMFQSGSDAVCWASLTRSGYSIQGTAMNGVALKVSDLAAGEALSTPLVSPSSDTTNDQ